PALERVGKDFALSLPSIGRTAGRATAGRDSEEGRINPMKFLWNRAPRSDRWLFALSMLLLAASVIAIGARERSLLASSKEEEFSRFVDVAAEVYSEISNKYVDEVDSRRVLEGALQGMFRALDEHSQYMNPDLLSSLE